MKIQRRHDTPLMEWKIYLIIACLTHPAYSCDLSITLPPEEVFGYAGERISYSCTICGGTMYWKVNGTAIHHFYGEPYYLEEIQGNPGAISLMGLPELNNVPIECLAYSRGTMVYSDPISIHVKLSEPTELASHLDLSSISLSWNPPHAVPNANNIIAYVLNVSVVSEMDCFEHINATTSNFNYTIPYSKLNITQFSVCTLQFTVSAVDNAGRGKLASGNATLPLILSSCNTGFKLYLGIAVGVMFVFAIVIGVLAGRSCRRKQLQAKKLSQNLESPHVI